MHGIFPRFDAGSEVQYLLGDGICRNDDIIETDVLVFWVLVYELKHFIVLTVELNGGRVDCVVDCVKHLDIVEEWLIFLG